MSDQRQRARLAENRIVELEAELEQARKLLQTRDEDLDAAAAIIRKWSKRNQRYRDALERIVRSGAYPEAEIARDALAGDK